MNKKRSSGWLGLLIALFFSSVALTQEAMPCADGIESLDYRAYDLLMKVDILDADVAAYRQLLAECGAGYQKFSAGKRREFLQLLNTLMTRVDTVYQRLSSEEIYLPGGLTDKAKLRLQRILEIKEAIKQFYLTMLSQHIPLDKGWGDTFVSNLYLGYESVDIDAFPRYGGGRFGANLYYQMNGSLDKKGMWGRHIFGEALLTNSAENSVEAVNEAYEVDLNFFAPYAMAGDRKGRWALGPVVGLKMKKLSGINVSRWEHMAGVRAARSADLYIEGRYGRVGGVSDPRIELRGQLPLIMVFKGDVIVGGVVNLSTESAAGNGDLMQLYLVWQINFIDLMEY